MNQHPDFLSPSDSEGKMLGNQAPGEQSRVIPVIEEQIKVDKKVIDSGIVRITKSVSEHEESVNMALDHEEIKVERIALNQYVETAPDVRYEGDTMVIPVLREVMVKRLLLVEELRVTKHTSQIVTTQEVTLRKEEVVVEHIAINPAFDKKSGIAST
ncbi:MAG: YsnF/AvaK domain-containing protein [Bacteroidota bacterium]